MLENIGYGKDSIKLGFTKHMQCVHIYFANITMVSASTVQPLTNLDFLCILNKTLKCLCVLYMKKRIEETCFI